MPAPLLAFSTLAFPGDRLEDVAELGRTAGYGGIELRLIDGELIPPSLPAAEVRRVREAIAGLELVALDTSVRLSDEDVKEQIAAYLRLAHELGAPVIRVFGGALGDDPAERDRRLGHGAEALAGIADQATEIGVKVGVETHDDFSASADLAELLARIEHTAIGAVWDSHHPWRMGEDPTTVYANVGKRVLLAQVKDARRSDEQPSGWQLVLLGEGEVPVRSMFEVLAENGYQGAISVEWERHWHRELEEAAVALPQHLALMNEWLAAIPAWSDTAQR